MGYTVPYGALYGLSYAPFFSTCMPVRQFKNRSGIDCASFLVKAMMEGSIGRRLRLPEDVRKVYQSLREGRRDRTNVYRRLLGLICASLFYNLITLD